MNGLNVLAGARPLAVLLMSIALFACGGGGSGGSGGTSAAPPAQPGPVPVPEPTPQPLTESEAVRFLSQATFGPSPASIAQVMESGLEQWFLDQLALPASLHLETVLAGFPEDGSFYDENGQPLPGLIFLPSNSLWQTMITADDQLRQRMAFALSQILVVSADSNLIQVPQTLTHYADILTAGAFGNYRALLEDVTYSPAMAIYLTYLKNEKADPQTGRVPDENYARELLQLFTVGLVELNLDGTPVTNAQGEQIELYNNSDITELAKVFTGLSFSGVGFRAPVRLVPFPSFYAPLTAFDQFHSTQAKAFLGTTIPAGTGASASIASALDAIFAHPNVGPFIGRQLIQRFVTSSPAPEYVARVAASFDAGTYTLPSGTVVGEGQRGDLRAVLAAVLFDERARSSTTLDDETFGKLREPVLRFTHWARAFEVNTADASNEALLRNTSSSETLGQHPYLSPSVFNFYRPGYIAPGTETGAAGLTAPELQITNATSVVGYPNFMTTYALGNSPQILRNRPRGFEASYRTEADLAGDPQALVNHLNTLLAHGRLRADTRSRIASIISRLNGTTEEGRQLRARVASVLVMTSPEYIVLR